MRAYAIAIWLCAAVFADAPNTTVSSLVDNVTALLAVDRDDARIADELRNVHLHESLSDEVVTMLRQMGAGPATVRELQAIARKTRKLPPPPQAPLSLTPDPSAAERAAMVDAARRYATGYLASLPDFTCIREARRFHAGQVIHQLMPSTTNVSIDSRTVVNNRWSLSGSYTAEASIVHGEDRYKITRVNNRPSSESFDQLRDKVSWGEFGGMLKDVFSADPEFQWDRWQVTGGRRAAVFAFYVDPAHSGYWVCCPRVTSPYRGFVFADPQSGEVLRLIIIATGLTSRTPILAGAHVLDYGNVTIGGRSYLLPRRAMAYRSDGSGETREEIDYRDYRKFGAESTLSFPSGEH